MFYLILLVVSFAIYVIYTHAEITDKDGKVTRAAVIITPKSVGIEAMDVAGATTMGSLTAGKRAVSWSAERNAMGEESLNNSGWKESKGFTRGGDRATKAVNHFIDTPFFTEESQ